MTTEDSWDSFIAIMNNTEDTGFQKTLENYSKIWHNKYIIIYKNYKKEEQVYTNFKRMKVISCKLSK